VQIISNIWVGFDADEIRHLVNVLPFCTEYVL